METTVGDLAAIVGGEVVGDAATVIRGVNGIDAAAAGDITFIGNPKYAGMLDTTQASAVIVSRDTTAATCTLIQVEIPHLAFAQVLQHFMEAKQSLPTGIHPTAVIDDTAEVAPDANIDAHVRIAARAVIGAGAVLYAGVYIGAGSTVGAGSVIHPNVVICEDVHLGRRCLVHSGVVLGSDGFGFVPVDGVQHKIPQVGSVVIGDDVEIGSNSCIDRATFGETRIGNGTKIDNLVQIGHNVRIGEHCVISGMSGLAGSTILGDRVTVAANAGFAGHLTVGDGATIGGRAGVTKSVPAGKTVSGFPARDHDEAQRMRASVRRLPEALKRLRELERRLAAVEGKTDGKTADDC